MAENKKSFLLYADLIHTVRKMPPDKAGELFLTILKYVNDEDPLVEDIIVDLVFEPIKQQLKRDLSKWEDKSLKRSEAGRRGGIKSGEAKKSKQKQIEANSLLIKQTVHDTVNDNVTVNVNKRDTMDNSHDIKNSNLFKQPKIPTKQQVLEAIVNAGGNKEMAKSFYEKYESTGWFLNGSPVVNYIILAERFVTNWKKNDKKEEPQQTAPTLRTLPNHGI